MVAEGRRALVLEVGVRVGGGRHALVEWVAFAGDGGAAVAVYVRQEARLAEGRLALAAVLGRAAIAAVLAAVEAVLAAARVDAEEVLDLLRDLAVGAIDLLVGGDGHAGEGALRVLGRGGRVAGRAEELRHGCGAALSPGRGGRVEGRAMRGWWMGWRGSQSMGRRSEPGQ